MDNNGIRAVMKTQGADMHDPRWLRVAQAFLRCSSSNAKNSASGVFLNPDLNKNNWPAMAPSAVERALSKLPRENITMSGKNPGRPVVLLFRSLLSEAGKENGAGRIHQATFYLASALCKAGVKVVFSDLRMPASPDGDFEGIKEFDALLRDNPDINIAGISLLEDYFLSARRLVSLIADKLDCFVFLGGIMPTTHPFSVLAHFPQAHFVVRGAGEEALPSAALALGGARPGEGMPTTVAATLCRLAGLVGRCGDTLVLGSPETVNRVSLQTPQLDMRLLRRADMDEGGRFSLSRGCANNCSFCTSFDRSAYHAVPFNACKDIFAAYLERAGEIYGGQKRVPVLARGIGFYDDDFLGDADRAIQLLHYFSRGPLYIDFAQTGIRSFHSGKKPNRTLLAALSTAAFGQRRNATAREKTDLYIGTENFCAAELVRLGKGYGLKEVESVVKALSSAGIRQAHHFIFCNAFTTADDILSSLSRLRALRQSNCGNFALLSPVIRRLRSFEGSRSRFAAQKAGLGACLFSRASLKIKGLPEFDYVLAGDDSPADALAARLAAAAVPLLDKGDFDAALETALYACTHEWGKLSAASPAASALESLLGKHMPQLAPGGRSCRC